MEGEKGVVVLVDGGEDEGERRRSELGLKLRYWRKGES